MSETECAKPRNRVQEYENAARKMFEQRCSEGTRPVMFNLTQVANGEYASIFTEMAWKWYWAGMNDRDGAF